MAEPKGPAFYIEECHIPSLAAFGTSGLTLTGDYFVVRRAAGPLKGYPLLVTGRMDLAQYFARELARVGEEKIQRLWAQGELTEPKED